MEKQDRVRIRALAQDIIDLIDDRTNVPSHFDTYEEFMGYKADEILKELRNRDKMDDRLR